MQPLEIPEPALGPKLEWMLLSHQVSQAELVEALTYEYYLILYRYALSLLEYPREANLAARRTIMRAAQRADSYRIGQGVSGWIEGIGEEVSQEIIRQRKYRRFIPKAIAEISSGSRRIPIQTIPDDKQELDDAQVQFITGAVLSDMRAFSRRSKVTRGVLWMTLAGLALLLLVALNAGDEAEPTGSGDRPIQTQRADALYQKSTLPTSSISTSASSLANETPLTMDSNMDEIIQLARSSGDFWNNLWADGLVIDYGPRGYRGPALVQREQIWLTPPGHGRVLTGPLHEGKPNRLWVTMSGQVIMGDQDKDDWEHFLGSGMIDYTEFRPLLRPAFAYFDEGRIVLLGKEFVAGREAIILDYILRSGRHEGRYSIDTQTGLGLRLRRYTDNSLTWVREELIFTEVEFNTEIPSSLFGPTYERPLKYASGSIGMPETAQTRAENVLVDGIGGRSLLPKLETYTFFNPAHLELTFQFTNITRLGASADVADVYTGGHFLGSVPLDDPWRLQCSRSPDGGTVAFYAEAASYREDAAPLRWFDIIDLEKVHYSEPEIIPDSNLAFSPDSSQLAVSGCSSAPEQDCGLFLLDLDSGFARQLIDLEGATSVVWNPEGHQIAFLGGREGDPEWQIYIVESEDGEVVYKDRVSMVLGNIRPRSDSPLSDWEVRFPVTNRGLRDCVNAQ